MYTYRYLYIPTYTSTYLHIPLHTYIYLCTVSTLLLVYVDDGAKLQGRLNYTAGNGLIQVSFFLGLMQVCRQVESSWSKNQTWCNLIFSDSLQNLLKQLAWSLWIKSLGNQLASSDVNASKYRLNDGKATSLWQTCYNLRLSSCVRDNLNLTYRHSLWKKSGQNPDQLFLKLFYYNVFPRFRSINAR